MDIDKLRKETPGTKNVLHFNNAGASLMPRSVSDAVINYQREESLWGGYETANKYRQSINETYDVIANFINAKPTEIALIENATVAWNMAFWAIDFCEGDRILTSKAEYASNYISYLKLKKEVSVKVEVIPSDNAGQTSVEALEQLMDDRVKLISITHIPTNSGLVNPIEEIGEIAHSYSCLYLVDACQSVGQYPINVQKIGCDMLSATGRKYLRGPRGTGFLYVNKDVLADLTPPFVDLHAAEWTSSGDYKIRNDARRFENWEMNYAGILGLKEAVSYANTIGITSIWNRIVGLAEELRTKLIELPNVTVQDIGKTKGGLVTFTVDGHSTNEIQKELHKKGINISTSSIKSTRLDMEERNLTEVVRASIHYYNTRQEIEQFIITLSTILD
ncbi:aminotransferase class V-fold PLP-dependent enzyme [Fodinibius sp. Rm-B-1B1-1]|uniref:aminotransferase class V-fold PLP-dependent enzyme n=1 Tax=Fodinibius alkaliphilus TaxID=3140241 RepID=UPI00315A37A0